MDPNFWLDRWQSNEIGFHQPMVQPALERHWAGLGVKPGARVFVPLAGKSLDMVWLAERGHEVIGAELSKLAVDTFFSDRSRAASIVTEGQHSVHRAGPYEVWCGDYFELPAHATSRIGAVYDRAALVAMPVTLQQRYASKLAELTPRDAPVLLVSLEYDPSQMDGPPFPIPRSQIESLFGQSFDITPLDAREGLPASPNLKKRGLTWLKEPIYLLRRNGRAHG